MIRQKSVKGRRWRPLVVGVVTSPAEIRAAIKLRIPPDLLELRLDHFWPKLDELEKQLPHFAAGRTSLIMTARDPSEGGVHKLSGRVRHELLLRFFSYADFIDIELRHAVGMSPIVTEARQQGVGLILSFHDFNATPSVRHLKSKARAAKHLGADIFKVATRTDAKTEVVRLRQFFLEAGADIPISAMGIGKLGRTARKELAELGSVLVYGSIGRAQVAGQPSVSEIQRWKPIE